MVDPRVNEIVAMAMIGDGVLAVLEPERHCRLWEFGPKGYREVIRWCADHPAATRVFGAMELGLGIWLGSRQRPPMEQEGISSPARIPGEPEPPPATAAA